MKRIPNLNQALTSIVIVHTFLQLLTKIQLRTPYTYSTETTSLAAPEVKVSYSELHLETNHA